MTQDLGTQRFALSPMQLGMLIDYLREPAAGFDVEQLVIHLSEAIDTARLRAAWEALVSRHEMLRARFVWEGLATPAQEIIDHVAVPFVVLDMHELPEEGRDEWLHTFCEADRARGFDLKCAPLLRLQLVQWGEKAFSLVWSFHHGLIDGRCFPVLLREVFEIYAALKRGEVVKRSEPVSYRRYIDWLEQQAPVDGESFWRNTLSGFTTPTPLVVDGLGPTSDAGGRQGEACEAVEPAITEALHAFARDRDLTVNTVVMTAWAILLHKYSGEDDVLFGATRACRKASIPSADEIIGPFINTVPFRLKLHEDDGLSAVLRDVRKQWLDVRPFERFPLARMRGLSQVAPNRPLFETLVMFDRYELEASMRSLGGAWKARRLELHELPSVPVTLAAYDGDRLKLKISFDRQRLDHDTVTRWLWHLRGLIEQIVAAPDCAIKDLSLTLDPESARLAERLAASEEPASTSASARTESTLHELFEAQVARSPHRVAVTCGPQSLTYGELNSRANQVAHALRELGVGPDVLVGICIDRSLELVIGLLGILKAGGAYLPIDLAYPSERLAFMLKDAQAPVLLTQSKLLADVPVDSATVLCLDDADASAFRSHSTSNPAGNVTPRSLAYVIYTSGTTGQPKGSLIAHGNVTRLFSSTEPWFDFNEADVWTMFHSVAFDFSVWEIWGALLYGGRVVVVPFAVSRSPEAFYELLARERVTVLNQTPSAFRQLMQADASLAAMRLALRYVIFGGEALDMRTLKPWFERHGDAVPKLVNMYGITETTVHVTYRPLSRRDLDSGSVIGVPIPDLQVHILDSQRRPMPIGVPGEMYVGGAGLGRGYLRRPKLTSERFIHDHLTGREGARLYKTGDRARRLPSGDLEFVGRADDQVKIRGFRIELGEIEAVLIGHPAVRETAVLARQDADGDKRLTAYVVPKGAAPGISTLRDHLKKFLPDYMVPAAFVFLERLPLTASGKIDRKSLPAPASVRPDLSDEYDAPRTAAEHALVAIWAAALGLDQVGIHDNFFELGGDSILALQVVAGARSHRLKLTPALLFANPTIAGLAAAADGVEHGRIAEPPIEGDVPLTPIQEWFFEEDLDECHHYNQAFVFEVREPIEPAALEAALDAVGEHHDGFRLRFVRDGSGWRQFYATSREPAPLEWIDISNIADSEQPRQVELTAAARQTSFRLESGPLWRVVFFDLGPDRPGRLLVIVHHLVVDGVSWRPLIEDLETAYQQAKAGRRIELPAKTSSFKTWALRVRELAKAPPEGESAHWIAATTSGTAALTSSDDRSTSVPDTEGTAGRLEIALSVEETRALLQRVPSAYNTQINDVLLTALLLGWNRWSGARALYTNLEGHGRETLFEDVDLSRTIGWFTSLFPVFLELPANGADPGAVLKSVKEQLRRIPRRGIGYGIWRYLADGLIPDHAEPQLLFNYLGQMDQLLSGSRLFGFAPEPVGPWHSPTQRRRHAIEINSFVLGNALRLSWSFTASLGADGAIGRLAEEVLSALKELIAHCVSRDTTACTPSDYPLAQLDQVPLDRLLAGRKDVEDIYRLSPMQALLFSAHPQPELAVFDQWQCSLRGRLSVDAFREAWKATVQRHAILRTTIHDERFGAPLQMVHRNVELPWLTEDWRSVPPDRQHDRWSEFLTADRKRPLRLTDPPVMRFALVQLAENHWKFLWSVPAILLDGWSWPRVFSDASRLYAMASHDKPLALEPVRPYRDYIAWLQEQSPIDTRPFWQQTLAGVREPTPFVSESPDPDDGGDRYRRHTARLSAETTKLLESAARSQHVTLNTLVQAAWALILSRQSGQDDVVFGATFAGRPVSLPDAASIVGPFVNNLPVRVRVDWATTAGDFLRRLQRQVQELDAFQFAPLADIQRWSEVPFRHRLFESLVVFQNYAVDESARRFGQDVEVADFDGPIHTAYPLLLLAEPGPALQLTMIYDRRRIAQKAVQRWLADLQSLLHALPGHPTQPLAEVQPLLAGPLRLSRRAERPGVPSQNYVPPQTELERRIAVVWQTMFGSTHVGIDDNFFDLGGQSMLLVQLHHALREALSAEFPIVSLFAHPTIRSFARHLDRPARAGDPRADALNRAEQQRRAIGRMRQRLAE
jgi:amino acid adenylation domain-containing protein/non-ribosomal peptide synthase protein (TIGR01720 family)